MRRETIYINRSSEFLDPLGAITIATPEHPITRSLFLQPTAMTRPRGSIRGDRSIRVRLVQRTRRAARHWQDLPAEIPCLLRVGTGATLFLQSPMRSIMGLPVLPLRGLA